MCPPPSSSSLQAYWTKAFFVGFAWLATPLVLPVSPNMFWSSLCFQATRLELCYLPPACKAKNSSSLWSFLTFPQNHANTVFCSKMCCSISFSSSEASWQAVWKSVSFKVFQVLGKTCLKSVDFILEGIANSGKQRRLLYHCFEGRK